MSRFPIHSKILGAAATVLAIAFGAAPDAAAQLIQDSVVVATSNSIDPPSTYRVYNPLTATWTTGPGWAPTFIQSVEFDNTPDLFGVILSHNASGNLLAVNFGNAFTGFEVYNLATVGGPSSTSLWSIVEATGGAKGTNPMGAWLSQRGGSLAISPGNSYVAWFNFDVGQIYVHNYLPGALPGTGALAGAVISGPRRTGNGDGEGNPGGLTAIKVASTQGGTWLNDYMLLSFNAFGELILLDLRNHPLGGTENGTLAGFQPEVMTDWVVVNSEVSIDAQYTDVEYNPEIDPNHIYASATLNGSFVGALYVYDYDPLFGDITLNRSMTVPNLPNGSGREPREIAFDSEGNLWFSGYAGDQPPALPTGTDNLVMRFNDATNIAGWDPSDIEVVRLDTQYSPFNGLDVAKSLGSVIVGDVTMDYRVDLEDLNAVDNNWDPAGVVFHAYWEGDVNRDGVVDLSDRNQVLNNWSPGGYVVSVDGAGTALAGTEAPATSRSRPAAAAVVLVGLTLIGGALIRRRKN